MGQHYRGEYPILMQEQVELSRRYVDNEIERLFPGHSSWVHIPHRGNMYHFYRHNGNDIAFPRQIDLEVSVRIIRDELFELEPDQQDQLVEFGLANGDIAARVQVHLTDIDLENMPRAIRIFQHWAMLIMFRTNLQILC